MLWIEDDPGFREAMKRRLLARPEVLSIHTAENGGSALRSLERASRLLADLQFDVVLLDLELPDMSGLDALRRSKRAWPELAVVVLSGFEDPETIGGRS